MKKSDWALPITVAGILILLLIGMHQNLVNRFETIENKLQEGKVICLDKNVKTEKLADLLYQNKYAETLADARFIAEFMQKKLANDTIPEAIQDLNKRIWQVPATLIEQNGSEGFRKRLVQSREALGINETVAELYKNDQLPTTTKQEVVGNGYLVARVLIRNEEGKKLPMPGTFVRLDRHRMDSIGQVESVTLAYTRTDNEGKAQFEGLDPEDSYSLLPICKDYEFGSAQGTVDCKLADLKKEKEKVFVFTAQEHRIRLFDAITLQNIRNDQTLCVRTPKAFLQTLDLYFLGFLIAWIIVFALAYLRGGKPNILLASFLMAITGLSFLFMFGINDPLTERMLGKENAQGIIVGVACIAILQRVNIIKRFQSQYGFDWFKSALEFFCVPERILNKIPKGTGYAIMAILLTCLLLTPLGQAVGGMRVNLNLGGIIFQPSEIAKYLMVIFMAALFYEKGERIICYSNATIGNHYAKVGGISKLFFYKMRDLLWILGGIILLLVLYLGLGDMGPAMVMTLTFIVLYSLIKSRSEKRGGMNDLSMLVTGIVTFIACIGVGQWLHCQILMCGIWFLAWIMTGLARKQVWESAILFNLVIAVFLFSSGLLHAIGLDDIAGRLEDRKEMCVNTWGDLGLESGKFIPGVNTQVVEGLWGLASGGFTGQGLGNGSAKFIPAYHTDMILQSIGEQVGFCGLFILILLFSVLLYQTLRTGYHSNHLFTFYLCTGIAVVTAIQLLIITLGSTGFIPLTGITVPLLSYGRVSIILNLLAFGVVLSVSTHCRQSKIRSGFIEKYQQSMRIATWTYVILAGFVLSIFFHYQIWAREKTMLRPVLVYNTQGAAAIHYNPRIEKLVKKMKPGNIYDRKGVLIATSFVDSLKQYRNIYEQYKLDTDFRKVQQRYYPFGEHLFFMLGDYNNKLFFSSLNNSPRGFMAEARYLSELRGYDNQMRDKTGNPVRIDLVSDRYQPVRFLPANYEHRQNGFQLRDYSALLPYLKAGYNSDRIERFNARKEQWLDFGKLQPQDLILTIDAGLQTRLQQELQKQKKVGIKKWHRFQRTSIVVLDAHSGDLLASAVSPLPNYQRLAEEKEGYSDYNRPENEKKDHWQAYTDMDLGIIFPTAPGSTAKVISALAGIRSLKSTGNAITDIKYMVYDKERIHTGNGADPTGLVDFHTAIVQSSNNYFINLVNDLELYDELADIYAAAGIRFNYTSSYLIDYGEYNPKNGWTQLVTEESSAAINMYHDYIAQRTSDPKTQRRMKSEACKLWDLAWGQGTMSATPLAMARIAATVVNDGKMPITRFLLTGENPKFEEIASGKTQALLDAMKDEAHKPLRDGSRRFIKYPTLGGKTGTPERNITWEKGKTDSNANDAWYICFINNSDKNIREGENMKEHPSLAIAVRIERTGSAGSSAAKDLVNRLVMPILDDMGYVR